MPLVQLPLVAELREDRRPDARHRDGTESADHHRWDGPDQRRDGRPLIVHNIGAGTQVEDMLFDYVITGHYRYAP